MEGNCEGIGLYPGDGVYRRGFLHQGGLYSREQKLTMEQIWISPVVENILNKTADGAAYHGYWAKDIYKLNANFGTVDDLKDLADELHARGMVRFFQDTAFTCLPGIPQSINVATDSNSEFV
jgi:hypothetical protein